jgi:hypothetical protein
VDEVFDTKKYRNMGCGIIGSGWSHRIVFRPGIDIKEMQKNLKYEKV